MSAFKKKLSLTVILTNLFVCQSVYLHLELPVPRAICLSIQPEEGMCLDILLSLLEAA